MTRGRLGDCIAPGSVEKRWKGYNLSAVLQSWRQLLCYACADGPPFPMSPPLVTKITQQIHTMWARSLNIDESVVCCFLPRYMRLLRNTLKLEIVRLTTVQFLAVKNIRHQSLKCSWVLKKHTWTPKRRFLKGPCRPRILVHDYSFF